ncbi:helix-turn-helix domain-containing protein [Nocardia shimofusensis]|uniref:helix-turn-helix domain-containing protein n=1 Tax=Nocardia shimofusensis TaxID=228596 RepID=UPI000A9BCCBC|nr:helix-turn-helix transcriptional regulator [Nocardia shimofusensis]
MVLSQMTTGSTMPRRRLGRNLRDLRTRARMTTRTAARQLEWSEAKIWRIETGQTSLRSLDVEAMCKVYGAPADVVAPLAALAKETKARGWWTAYTDVVAEGFDIYIGLEEAARQLAGYEADLIPGLLQTEAYTRALLRTARPAAGATEIERRVELRRTRQSLLTRPGAPLRLDVVIPEAVLRHRVGGPEVAAEQLDHLRRICDLPTVRLRVIPAGSDYHAGMETSRFAILEFPADGTTAPEPPVVYVETFTGPVYLDKEADFARYRAAFADIASAAVDARELLDDAVTALA